MDKKVTVVITSYKYLNYLKDCLDSVIRQTYKVHEIIVSNDGSPDSMEQASLLYNIQQTTDIPITFLDKPNGGLASARNWGIKHATSEYIMCLDADDKLVPGAIEEHVKIMGEKTVAQCALMEFGDRHNVYTPLGANLLTLLRANSVYCNAMFPKKAWEESGGYDESETMRLGYEDWEYWIRLAALGYQFVTSDSIALRYRIHKASMTTQTTHPNHQKLYRYIYEKHKKLYEENHATINGMY